MNKTIKFSALILIFIACSPKLVKTTAVDSSIPTQADAAKASSKWEGTTLEDLNKGKMLFEGNCGKCHALPLINSEKESEWNKIVPNMAKKAKLAADAENYILKYVVTLSNR